jgi:PAS domain S-box-containing protein
MCTKLETAKETMNGVIAFVENGNKFQELFKHVRELSLLDMLWDNISIAMFYKDTENRLVKVNKCFSDICGIKKNELEGKHADVIKSAKPKLNIIEPLFSYNKKIFRTDKYPVIVDGKVIGVLGVSVELPNNEG